MSADVGIVVDSRRATVVAAAGTLFTVALLATAWTLAWLDGDLGVLNTGYGPDMLVPLGLSAVGAVVVARRPANRMGWLFLACGCVVALRAAAAQYAVLGLGSAHGLPGDRWAAWLTSVLIDLIFPAGLLLFILLLFPDGRLPTPRWRVVAWAAAAFSVVGAIGTAIDQSPVTLTDSLRPAANPIVLPLPSALHQAENLLWPVGMFLLACAAVAAVLRYRRSAGDERQQIKWFAVSVAALVVGTLVSFSIPGYLPFNLAIIIGVGVAIPVACAVAILRYRLYDIDVVLSRTVVYGSLAVFITTVYVGIAVGIGTLAGSGGKPNLWLSIVATAIVAVGFQPVRQRVQRIANRLVYGRRATPYEALSQFAANAGSEVLSDDLFPRMARVLAEGTGAQRADVWTRSGDGAMHVVASFPADAVPLQDVALDSDADSESLTHGVDRVVPVLHQGALLGALSVTKRAGESLTPVENGLLTDLAAQAGLLLRNAGLTADLRARYDDLRASRQRLVTAQDEERRRIERNLHDGAQQNLVALKVKLGLAEMLIDRDPPKALDTLEALKGDADEALETLRDLARGIYPPLLADQGLVAALQSQARKATVEVVVEADGVARYAQEGEAAAYFCILEALQNVQKYAHATTARVLLHGGDALRFEVHDDGNGFDMRATPRGSGLTNMADRLDALGGTLRVTSAPGRGTTVSGAIPLQALAVAS